jgi:hypothetical protein
MKMHVRPKRSMQPTAIEPGRHTILGHQSASLRRCQPFISAIEILHTCGKTVNLIHNRLYTSIPSMQIAYNGKRFQQNQQLKARFRHYRLHIQALIGRYAFTIARFLIKFYQLFSPASAGGVFDAGPGWPRAPRAILARLRRVTQRWTGGNGIRVQHAGAFTLVGYRASARASSTRTMGTGSGFAAAIANKILAIRSCRGGPGS